MNEKSVHPMHLDPVEAVVCLVDRSGSMACDDFPPSRLQAALTAVVALMDTKRAIDIRDRVAVAAFNDRSHVVAGFDTHRFTALEQARSLTATGSTNIHDGLALALKLLANEARRCPGAVQRIVLLSDGGHNTGPRPEKLLPQLRKRGVIVDTVAIGTPGRDEYDEALLRRLADATGGEFAVVQQVEALIRKYRALAQKKRQAQVGASTVSPQPGLRGRIRRIR